MNVGIRSISSMARDTVPAEVAITSNVSVPWQRMVEVTIAITPARVGSNRIPAKYG
ncbi:hypothetical protein D3C80_2120610 [compost metagenome]